VTSTPVPPLDEELPPPTLEDNGAELLLGARDEDTPTDEPAADDDAGAEADDPGWDDEDPTPDDADAAVTEDELPWDEAVMEEPPWLDGARDEEPMPETELVPPPLEPTCPPDEEPVMRSVHRPSTHAYVSRQSACSVQVAAGGVGQAIRAAHHVAATHQRNITATRAFCGNAMVAPGMGVPRQAMWKVYHARQTMPCANIALRG